MAKITIKASSHFPVNRRRIKETVWQALHEQGIEDPSQTELAISFVGDRKMATLNQAYLGREGTTDVLSFPLLETSRELTSYDAEFVSTPGNIFFLGDVVISYPQARRQAQRHNLLVDAEIDLLIQHGVLHLLGKHHK